MLPKFTSPLTKALRTSEGVLVWVVNVALAVGTIVDPSKLPPKEAAIVASALSAVHVASRTLLKIVAVQKGVGIGAPEAVDVPARLESLLEQSHIASKARFDEFGKLVNEALANLNTNLADHIRALAEAVEKANPKPAAAGVSPVAGAAGAPVQAAPQAGVSA